MKFTVLKERILVAPLKPSEWPGKHRIPETKIVMPDGSEAYAVDRIDFEFGTVSQCGPEVRLFHPGDCVFWRGGGTRPVLEDWIMMHEAEIDGVWEP